MRDTGSRTTMETSDRLTKSTTQPPRRHGARRPKNVALASSSSARAQTFRHQTSPPTSFTRFVVRDVEQARQRRPHRRLPVLGAGRAGHTSRTTRPVMRFLSSF